MTEDLGEALRLRRHALGGSLAAVAAELGEDPRIVTQWLQRPPTTPLARALARVLSA